METRVEERARGVPGSADAAEGVDSLRLRVGEGGEMNEEERAMGGKSSCIYTDISINCIS
jgi:hypothetical protein